MKISISGVYSSITRGAVRAECSGLCSWMKHDLAGLAFLLRTCTAWLLSVNHMAKSHEAQRLSVCFSVGSYSSCCAPNKPFSHRGTHRNVYEPWIFVPECVCLYSVYSQLIFFFGIYCGKLLWHLF